MEAVPNDYDRLPIWVKLLKLVAGWCPALGDLVGNRSLRALIDRVLDWICDGILGGERVSALSHARSRSRSEWKASS
jgi:hypothetical protein